MANSFLAVMAKHFGPKGDSPKAGQTLQEFSQEVKALGDEGKQWYYRELLKAGEDVEAPKPS